MVKTAGLPVAITTKLFERGWRSVTDLSNAKPAELVKGLGVDEPSATKLIAAATAALQ